MKKIYRLLALSALVTQAGGLAGQIVITVHSVPQCSECEIRIIPVTTLGDREGPGRVGRNNVVHRDLSGRYLEASPEVPGRILVFGPDGRFKRAFGKRGSEPGEYLFVRHIHSSEDNVHIFDTRQLRWTMLSNDFNVKRTSPFLGDISYVALVNDSTAVASEVIRTQERIGIPLHIWNANGEILASFGGDEGYRPGLPYLGSHPISLTDSGSVWMAARTRFEFEEWERGMGDWRSPTHPPGPRS